MLSNIRNFCIIAHIDHGKTTLSDRFLELTGAVAKREMVDQALDDMELERERGITIKSHPVRLNYKAPDGNEYILNLIDTPGHVDFSYEVSRSLAACEGAILLVDASQGVQAQTVANVRMALEHDLNIIPVLNKIDLPSADVDYCSQQIIDLIGGTKDEILKISSKTGEGLETLLDHIIKDVPPPKEPEDEKLRWLIFDSVYDPYRGVIVYGRVFSGTIRRGSRVRFMSNGLEYEIIEVGTFTPHMKAAEVIGPGEVGYFTALIRDASHVRVGDTVTETDDPAPEPLPVFTSPGLSSEFVHLVKMSVDLENQPDLETHFDESEYIETFLVGQDELADFIRKAEREGCGVDTKMYMWAISRGGFDV